MNHWQDFTGARINAGSGGSGGRGGDVGSHSSFSSTDNTHTGDKYLGPVDQGDNYHGPISNSAVGGQGNHNEINNGLGACDVQVLRGRETELTAQLLEVRRRIDAKRARERIAMLEAELAAALAELGVDDDNDDP